MKKIAANDSRQSVGLKWKTRKGLEDNVAFKEDGTMEVGKNIEVDGTLTLNAPEDLAFKTGSINATPEGYNVDGAGNVTIAGALTANNNGDVEVSKNLNVDGMATFGGGKNAIYQKTKIENLQGTEFSSTMGFLLLSGVGLSAGGQTTTNGPACLFLLNESSTDDGAMAKIGVPRNASGEIISSIAADDFSPYATFGTARRIIIANGDDQLQESVIYVDNLTSTSATPAIDSRFCLSDNPTVSLAKLATASQAKYQHTVTIKGARPAQGGGSCFITFTAYSSKNTPIDSAQDLIDVFGGCELSVSGMYSPSQGTNFGAVKLYLNDASTIADASLAYIDPSIINESGVKMSECGNLSFADDVFPN